MKRRTKKLTGKANWFRERKNEEGEPWGGRKEKKKKDEQIRRPDNVFFIPDTPEGN